MLYPQFKFTEEARPVVARELARRAMPRRILDRVWGGLAEFILLGESPPAGPAPTSDDLDERRFRREVIKALAYVWAEESDRKLVEKQSDVDRYTSAAYWLEHAGLHAALQTGLGLLRLLTMQQDRAVWASEPDHEGTGRAVSTPGANGHAIPGDEDGGKARYQEFLELTHDRHGKGRPWTEDVRQTAAYWEDETRRFPDADFWDDKQFLQSGLKSMLTLMRLLVDQLAQAVEAQQKENEANDPDLDEAVRARSSRAPEEG